MKNLSVLCFLGLVGLCFGAGGGISTGSDASIGRYSGEEEKRVTYRGQDFVAGGDKFSVTCVLDINEHLQWTLNSSPVVPGEAGFTMMEGPGRQGYVVSRLTVARAHPFHSGKYRCTPGSKESHTVFVIGGVPLQTDGTRLLEVGRPLEMTCQHISGVVNVQTTWQKDGQGLVENDHIKLFPNTTLYIASAVKEDLGEYTCKTGSMVEPKFFYVVELELHKHMPKSTTVLENDKLSLSCQVEGDPFPGVQWFINGEPAEEYINSSRLILSENEYHVPNASLLIKPIMKTDDGSYVCFISQYGIQMNTTTVVRVKDIYAALWPFLGIVAEVVLLCTIIFIYEKRRIRPNFEGSDSDQIADQKAKMENGKEAEVRQRK